jgi:hypothetical protein
MCISTLSQILAPVTSNATSQKLGVGALIAAMLILASSTSWACEEPAPVMLESARATVAVEAYDVEPEALRDWAGWMARLDKLLPAGTSVEANYLTGEVQLCTSDDESTCKVIAEDYEGRSPETVFGMVASALRPPQKGLAWLEGRSFVPMTIQLASTPLYDGAEGLAEQITNDTGAVRVSQAGSALVLTEEADDETWRFRVITGIYFAHDDAKKGLEQMRSLGHDGFVRKI